VRRTGRRTGSATGTAVREGFEPVGTVLDEVLRSLRLETRFAAAEATDRWSDAVGPEVIARTRCVGVRDGELLVEVQGATWMGHLAVLSQGIIDEMNQTLAPEKRLRAIRFVPMRSKEEIKR
jgi:predicted nucleic acid-binding Zn ribbon protein